MSIKNYLRNKDIGFWFSLAITLLSLITAIIYVVSYVGTSNINWISFILMLAAGVIGAILILFKQYKLVPYILWILVLLSLLFFVYGIYYYVSVVLVGIDIVGFSTEFYICTVLYLLTFVASIVNVFLRQIKEEVKKDE